MLIADRPAEPLRVREGEGQPQGVVPQPQAAVQQPQTVGPQSGITEQKRDVAAAVPAEAVERKAGLIRYCAYLRGMCPPRVQSC